jgi:hypothetical protein
LVKIWDCIKTKDVGFEVRNVTCEEYYHVDVSAILDCPDVFDVGDILFRRSQESDPKANNDKLMDYIHGRVLSSNVFEPLFAHR